MGRGTVITIVVSMGLHVGLATGLVAVAKQREVRRKAISVAVTEEKKRTPPKPKPPAPPKPIARPAPVKTASIAKEAPAPAPVHAAAPKAAPVAMNLAMSNTGLDIGPGIGLHGRAPAAAAAPVKAASGISERRTARMRE